MSAKPMSVPADSTESSRAEILVVLPRGWSLSKESFDLEENYWPIRLVKSLARFPHEANTWLGFGHTVGNGADDSTAAPYASNVPFCAAAILPPMTLGEKAWSMKAGSGEQVFFWAAVPLYLEELHFKLKNGADALLDLFDRHKVTERIDIQRPCVVSPDNAI